jgi:EpsI family protein
VASDVENVIGAEGAPAEQAHLDAARLVPVALAAVAVAATVYAFREIVALLEARVRGMNGVEVLLFEPADGSPAFVLGCAAWLLVRRLPRLRAAVGGASRPWAALAFGLPGAALCGWAYFVGEPFLLVPALSAILAAAALWLGGTPGLRAVALPSFVLLFAMPIPAPVLNAFIYSLQVMVAHTTAWLLAAVGLGTQWHADLIVRGDRVFQVIESCSGLRTIQTLFVSAFLYHDLFYRNRLQSALIVASSLVIAFVVNQIRVILIVLNPYSRYAAVHSAQGLVMIALGVFLLAAVDHALSRVLPRRPWWIRRRGVPSLPSGRLAVLAVGTVLLAFGTAAIPPWQMPPMHQTSLSSLPPVLGPWQGSGRKIDHQYLGSVAFSEWVHRSYENENDGAEVDVLLGSDRHIDPRVDFSSPKVVLPGPGWEIESRRPGKLASGRPIDVYLVRSGRQQMVAWVWQIDVAPRSTELWRTVSGIDRTRWRRPDRGVVVRISTELGDAPERVDERLQDVAGRVEAELGRILADAGT